MNRLLTSRTEKNAIFDFLRKIAVELLLPTLPPEAREPILTYLAWMKDQREGLFIRTNFKTEPALKSLTITIEASFEDTKGMVRQ